MQSNNMIPKNTYEFLINELDHLPAATHLILVLDPGGKLCLTNEASTGQIIESGSVWKVIRYDGNDLAFRRQFNPTQTTLVWVTGSRVQTDPIQIDLTSLLDIVRRADYIFDFSLLGCLQALFPNVIWPLEPISYYSDLIASHLGDFVEAYKNLKPHLDTYAALNAFSIQTLILSCLQPAAQPVEFLFRVDSPVALLKKYITLAWTFEWDDVGFHLLQKQAREASLLSLGGLESWFEVDIHGLAQLVYFYRALSLARIPNIINQIRGLGLLSFDPESLEAGLGQVITLWEKDLYWRNRLIKNAETDLEMDTVRKATKLLSSDLSQLIKNLECVETPALLYSLMERLVITFEKEGRTQDLLETWQQNRPDIIDQIDEDLTIYTPLLKALIGVLDEAAYIQKSIMKELVTISSLENLVKWYVQGQYYDLEYAHARAVMLSGRIKDEILRSCIQRILEKIRGQLREYLDSADHILADQIGQNWYTYITSPELSSNILRDFVERPKLSPTDSASLWLIIFDGMRYDTWEAIVKPNLQKVFEIKKEKTYLCPLPSWTSIARTSITAGRTPDLWKGYQNKISYNQALLAGKFFGLPENQYSQKLRFYSGMESDRIYNQFDRKRRYPYNILVFNISDDDLHKQRDNIGALNENIKSAMTQILHFLDGLIQKDDTVIITSDHGFIELDPGYSIEVKDSNKWQHYIDGGEHPVHFRFIRSEDPIEDLSNENALSFEWKIPDGKFAVAVGRRWFQREGSKNSVRYDHGGLSFAEMVVPGAVMQSIRERKLDLRFDSLPNEIVVDEGQVISITVCVINKGNQPGVFDLSYKLDTDKSQRKLNVQISPNGKYDIQLKVDSIILSDERKTSKLTLTLEYVAINGQSQIRRQDIPIKIIEKKDVVKISLGGLDDLDI